ncbi:tetratricopeptide repeat protein [Demequina sp. B12]|uniref:tetratricopeptide repeat protein n=1 Tax=Demequina sp. B12 TaxID=2992757 RepID=UPI00237A49DE|nr:tetratricopeptide repeat protein [Demequina sp. B12]MDE0573899.1 tetratricopeptide repeat protein [Demequina sp. B12]
MSTNNPEVPLRGAPDLSHLAAAPQATPDIPVSSQGGGLGAPGASGAAPAPGAAAPGATPAAGSPAQVQVIDVNDANLNDLAQSSTQVPIVIVFLSSASPASKQLVDRMRGIIARYDGRLVLGQCDIDTNGGIAQALQISAVPTTMALIAARPAPLFQGAPDDDQITGVLDQVLEIAAQNGVTGRAAAAAPQEADAAEPEPEPLPPLHQEAYDAIEREDYAAAIDAYDRALRENPKDADARAGRAQVSLMERSRTADLAAVRKAAADDPADLDAQLAVADMDIMGGQIEDAFGRLIDAVRTHFGDDRERIRVRLVELFDVVGTEDSRVVEARRALAAALF